MHRDGHIIEEIIEYSNMSEAFDRVLRGTERKESGQGQKLLGQREEVIRRFMESISDGSFRVGDYHEREIRENGKLRTLQILTMRDRIGVYGIMNVVDRHLYLRYIRTTGASIKNRGTHDLMDKIRQDMQADPEGTRYAYKFDIRRFYDSIDQDIACRTLRQVFKDKKLLAILDSFIHLLAEGISFGLRSSQAVGNLLLSLSLDHKLKDEMGVRYYYRYCDDGVVLASSKRELWVIRDAIHDLLSEVKLEVKPNERVFPVTDGIDFLGYVIYPTHVKLRKRIKQKFARKMHEVKSRKRRKELEASFKGMALHANCNRLYNVITGKDMKSFKELNVTFQPEDGKKRFPGELISIRELVNLPIIVKDFETDIKTDQGEGRYLVAIEQDGEPKKYFTNSVEMKNILDQIRDMKDGFPFETTIKSEKTSKGYPKYVFT